jgi:hypothetical protein
VRMNGKTQDTRAQRRVPRTNETQDEFGLASSAAIQRVGTDDALFPRRKELLSFGILVEDPELSAWSSRVMRQP